MDLDTSGPENRLHRELGQLLDLSARERSRRLRALRHTEPDLAAELEELLAIDAAAGELLDRSVGASLGDLVRDASKASGSSRHEAPSSAADRSSSVEPAPEVPGWRLGEELGRGATGLVFEARRAANPDQRAAVKVLHSHLQSDAARQRFEVERRALAQLEHPGIARLIDSGTTADGHPFVAMELIRGERIDHFAERTGASRRQRIELLLEVCDAVAAAHRSLIIHRDLKPSNLLVDGTGRVRLLDFGIASSAANDRDTDRTATDSEHLAAPWTPGYASPEQRRGLPVGTSSDVYSLGVVAWRLLAGCRPDADPERRRAQLAEAGVHGVDLRSVLRRAVAEQRGQRYPTVDAFAADLGRVLSGHTVDALPVSGWGVFTRLVRRNRWTSATAALTLIVLIASLILLSAANRRIHREQQRAQEQASRASGALAYLERMLALASEPQEDGQAPTLIDLLENAELRLAEELRDQPQVQLELLRLLSNQYLRMSFFEQSVRVAEQGLSLVESGVLGAAESERELVPTLNRYGYSLIRAGRHQEGAAVLDRALDLLHDRQSIDTELELQALRFQSYAAGVRPPAETLRLRERILLLERRRAETDGPSDRLAQALDDVARSLHFSGESDRAVELLEEAVEIRRALGMPASEVAFLLANLAEIENGRGMPERARERAEEAIRGFQTDEQTVGRVSQIRTSLQLASAEAVLGATDEAIRHARTALERQESLPGRGASYAEALRLVGGVLCQTGRYDEGTRHLRRAVELLAQSYPSDGWRVARGEATLGLCLAWSTQASDAQGATSDRAGLEARRLLERSGKNLEQVLGPESPVLKAVRRGTGPLAADRFAHPLP